MLQSRVTANGRVGATAAVYSAAILGAVLPQVAVHSRERIVHKVDMPVRSCVRC